MMARCLALIAGVIVGSSVAVAQEKAASKSFSGWTGTCDNLGDCVAIGTSQGDLFYVRIARAAGGEAEPSVKIILVPAAMLSGTGPAFRLKVTTKGKTTALAPLRTGRRDMNGAFFVPIAPGAASHAFIDAIRDSDTLDYVLLSAKGTLDLEGLSATLRWIDDRQMRAGTTTALVAKGAAPPSRVPPRRSPPSIQAAKAGSVAAIAEPEIDPELIRRTGTLSDCQKDVVEAHEGYRVWRLALDARLVEIPCLRAAYNATSAFYVTDAHGGAIRPAALPQAFADDSDTAANIVTNAAFNTDTMALSEFGKARGLGDCGETRTWVWTGEAFVLLNATRLDACPGALAEDWPAVFTAERGDAKKREAPR